MYENANKPDESLESIHIRLFEVKELYTLTIQPWR